MAITPFIDAAQARTLAAIRRPSLEVQASQGRAMAAINFPTDFINTSQARTLSSVRSTNPMPVTQARVMVAVRGQVTNPKLRAWTYTLDGHDYYILRLGDFKTLVFDLTTKQWSWFASKDSLRWRANTGFNWRSAGSNPHFYGSNVVVGDDTFGLIWVLDPLFGLDESTQENSDPITFDRVATGQMTQRDRTTTPVYSVYLTCSFGDPALTANTVTLEYSDDQGHTYVAADEPMVAVKDDYDQEFSWMSLGLVKAPGRLFRITDNGSFARIDELDVNA